MIHTSTAIPSSLEFDGFALIPSLLSEAQLDELYCALEEVRNSEESRNSAGLRNLLRRSPIVKGFALSSPLIEISGQILGPGVHPVRAILFDKTPTTNWYVTWHQDLTIPVKEKRETPGFTSWSEKDGVIHVQPPTEVLEQMVALRIHIDDCPVDNGAIKFIAGSHAAGILDPTQISDWKSSHLIVSCPAARGDLIIMRPLILHSSSVSNSPEHRRVLHIEYAAGDLPHGLDWAEA